MCLWCLDISPWKTGEITTGEFDEGKFFAGKFDKVEFFARKFYRG